MTSPTSSPKTEVVEIIARDFPRLMLDSAQGIDTRRAETSVAQAQSRSDKSPTPQRGDAPKGYLTIPKLDTRS